MKLNEGYAEKLAATLKSKRAQLENEGLPQLREQFKIIETAFNGLAGILLRKAVIHEDTWAVDSRISEVSTPPEGSFTEPEKVEQMSIRVSQYRAQLEFLTNYYQFSVEFLTMDRIKRLLSINRYFNFLQFSGTSTNMNTRTLFLMLDTVRKGSDQLSVGVINDGLLHLERASKAINQLLKELTQYHKETWKLQLRLSVMALVEADRDFAVTHADDVVKQIRRRFAEALPGQPFYPELALEVLSEETGQDGERAMATILNELAVRETPGKDKKKAENFRAIIQDGIRQLISIDLQLNDISRKLQENSVLLQGERMTFWVKVRTAVASLFNPQAKSIFYEIEYVDPVSSQQRSERLDFGSFMENLVKRARLYASVNARSGPVFQRLEAAPDEQLYAFLEKNLEEMQSVHRRLSGLDAFFRTEVSRENRARLHGIKLESDTIKSVIIKANQKKHEYVDKREELEQMKKLGISQL